MLAAERIFQELEALAADQAPMNEAALNRRIARISEVLRIPEQRTRRLLSAVIVAQMLPVGVTVKGGIGIKIRLGELGTRATRDLDLSAQDQLETHSLLEVSLRRGWGEAPPSRSQLRKNPHAPHRTAFFGDLQTGRVPKGPGGISPQYLMKPHKVTLYFLTKQTTVAAIPVEIGFDEFEGSHIAPPEQLLSDEIAAAVAALGFGRAALVPVISIEQQLAQKIHAVTDPLLSRGHDLVDIQLLWAEANERPGGLELPTLAKLCRRTFSYRSPSRPANAPHHWPPDVTRLAILQEGYETALNEAQAGLAEPPKSLAQTVEEATKKLREIVSTIDQADHS